MEFTGSKRGKKRKRKHRNLVNKIRCDRLKVEVKSDRRNNFKTTHNFGFKKQKLNHSTMEASAFWKNYEAAYEWQKRHNVTWWKTRCYALEHENSVLRRTIRNLAMNKNHRLNSWNHLYSKEKNEHFNDSDDCIADDNIEFHLNEDMMNFLAQSIQHKIELKNKREFDIISDNNALESDDTKKSSMELFHQRSEEAGLLYGKQSSKILAMETALQTTMERHIDRKKPQYWPNIPLKL